MITAIRLHNQVRDDTPVYTKDVEVTETAVSKNENSINQNTKEI